MKSILILALFVSLGLMSEKAQSQTLKQYEVFFGKPIKDSKDLKWKSDEVTKLPKSMAVLEDERHQVKIIFRNGESLVLPSNFSVFDQTNGILDNIFISPFSQAEEPENAVTQFNKIISAPSAGMQRTIQQFFQNGVTAGMVGNETFLRHIIGGDFMLQIGFRYDVWAKAVDKKTVYHPFFKFYRNDPK